jgi:hypothetical protein
MIALENYIGREKLKELAEEYNAETLKYIKNSRSSNTFSAIVNEYPNLITGSIDTITSLSAEILNDKGIEFTTLTDHASNSYTYFFSKEKMESNGTVKMSYWLAKKLGVRVCPYCNQQYTFTITNGKGIRPEFDHFLPKSKFPLLALSFYNLIPSCHNCNHVKSDENFSLNNNLYPYSESFHEQMKFKIKNYSTEMFTQSKSNFKNASTQNMDIKLVPKGDLHEKALKNVKAFRLEDIYNEHKDYAQEIIYKATYYSDALLQSYHGAFGDTFDQDFLDQMYYGNYLKLEEIMERPLAKLTQDIIEQFGLRRRD